MTNQNKYAQDGVNVEVGDDFSSIAGNICKSTYNNSKFVDVHDLSGGHFRGKRAYRFIGLPDGYLIDQSSDGNGTKVILTDAAGNYLYAARDLVAMTSGDMVASGGLPLVLNNILDTSSLGLNGSPSFRAAVDLLGGLSIVAKEENLVVFKGETAELGVCVSSENPNALLKFNWGATVTGVTHPDKIITGDTLAPGQIVIALREYGFRSNGISAVRKAFSMKYSNHGLLWWNNPNAKEDIIAAAIPSVSYNHLIAHLNGWYSEDFSPVVKLHAVAHITGGGIKSKFGDDLIFKNSLSANLHNLWPMPEIMNKCAEWRGLETEEIYNTWNAGNGMLLVVDESDIEKVINLAKHYSIEAQVAGEIGHSNIHNALRIRHEGRYISYHPKTK